MVIQRDIDLGGGIIRYGADKNFRFRNSVFMALAPPSTPSTPSSSSSLFYQTREKMSASLMPFAMMWRFVQNQGVQNAT